jgi:hypothetical protein
MKEILSQLKRSERLCPPLGKEHNVCQTQRQIPAAGKLLFAMVVHIPREGQGRLQTPVNISLTQSKSAD